MPSFVKENNTYKYLYFKCCDYFRQEQFLTEAEMQSLYDQEYSVFNRKGIYHQVMLWTIKNRVKRFRTHIEGKSILEIGCGTGEFLHFSRSSNPHSKSKGIETSEFASAYANKEYSLDVTCTTVEKFNTEEKFDTIFLFHVIEHLKYPDVVIEKCKNMLKENGTLIMETPNCASFERKFYGNHWVGWSVPFHTFIFSPTALLSLLNKQLMKGDITYLPLSNSYSSLLPFLFHHTNPLLLPFKFLEFLIKTTLSPWQKTSSNIVAIAKNYNRS
jgi:2-polyprenyl-3-methyl-5-hydroxy-6-metoxy-1,4-benzoquinol methylase